MNGILSIFKNIFKKSLEETKDDGDLQETAGEVIGNLVEGAADKVSESASEAIEETVVDKVKDSFGKIYENIDLEEAEGFEKSLNHSAELTEGLAKATEIETISTVENNAAKRVNIVENVEDAASEGALSGAKKTETIEENKNTLATIKNTAAKIANAAVKHPLITATIALAAATAVITYAIYKYNHRLDDAIKKDKELLEKQKERLEVIEKEIDATNKQIESLEDLAKQYQDVIEGSQEYYDIANKIAELQPSLVIGYDENGNAILANTDKINDQIEALKELRREQLEQKKFEATDIVDTSAKTINDYRAKKEDVDERLVSAKEDLEEARKELEVAKADYEASIANEFEDSQYALDRYVNQGNVVAGFEKTYNDLLEESKTVSQGLNEAKQEWTSNIAYLFDDIPDALSDSEKDYEKAVRQFAIDIANSSEEAMSSVDFLALYNGLKTDESKKALSSFFKLDTNIPRGEYVKEAQQVYDNIIESLTETGFELDEDDKLALKIALKIDGEAEKNYQNQRNKFTKSVGFKGKNKSLATSWYDNRTAEELKLIEDNIDKFRSLKYIDAEHLEKSLDNVLDKLKKANDEIEDLSYSLSDFEEKENEIESLQSLYNQFVENVEDGQVKVPLDISDVEGLREKWEDIVGKENFEEFELTVTTEGFEDGYQKAFDKMLSKYLSVQISMRGATKETAAMMKTQLKMDGLTEESADNFVNAKMAEAKAYEFTERAKQNDKIITQENIDAYIAECEQLGIATDLMGDYLTEAMLVDGISIEGNDEWLDELAQKLGLDISLLKELKSLSGDEFSSEAFNPNKGEWNGNFSGVSDPKLRKILLEKQQENIKTKNDEAYEKGVFDLDKAKEAAGKTGEEAGDAYVEAFEKELQELNDLKDAGILSEKEYLDRLQALYIKYFANRKEYLKEFAKYEKQYLEGMQSLYSSAISAAITLLNDEKEDIEKARDDALDDLEDAKQNEIDPINDHIKALEDEKDSLEKEREAMQKANDERERQINLQKAQYELERANSQRTRLIKINVRSYSNIA